MSESATNAGEAVINGVTSGLTGIAEWFNTAFNSVGGLLYNADTGLTVVGYILCIVIGLSIVGFAIGLVLRLVRSIRARSY